MEPAPAGATGVRRHGHQVPPSPPRPCPGRSALEWCQPAGDIWYVNVLPPLVKVSDRSLPVQLYEPCSGEGVTGLVTPATVMVASSVTVETGKVPECDVVLGEKP